jgi:hypothetical protein
MEAGVTWLQLKEVVSFLSPFIGTLIWIFTFYARDKKERLNEINEIKLKQHELELKMTGDFLKKDEFNTWVVRLDDSLRRIHERLDRRPNSRQKEE